MKVRVLPDAVVNQIAAGEVVERPASVVKELVENALDAGSTRIEVQLKGGGRDRIRISDDGHGMEREDALMCLERHATSKIRSSEDLFGVASLGFRGEAIPSIASVSKLTIQSNAGEDEGVRIEVVGGELRTARAAGCPRGTVMDVRDLFFNVPARRKFLRTVATELAHCQEAIARQALGRPDAGFRLVHDGRVLLDTAAGPSADRVRDVLGRDAERLIDVDFRRSACSGIGHISPLSVHRPAAKALYLYVNGRFVRDPVVRRAVTDAYRDRVPKGRHPLVVLFLTLEAGEVDVNVHPAKTEVRFRSPRSVQEAITEGLREALNRQTIQAAPRRTPRYEAPAPTLPLRAAPPPPPAHPDDDPAVKVAATVLSRVEVPAPVEPLPVEAPTPVATPVFQAIPASELLAAEPEPSSTRSLRPIGPYGRRWMLCEGDDELVIVDHVRAEALLAERRLRRDGSGQRLLVPRRERLSEREVGVLEQAAEALAGLGLELVKMSPTEMALRTVPVVLPRLHTDGLLKKLAAAPERAATILVESQKLPDAPDARGLRAMLASLEEAGLDAVVGRIPTRELAKHR